MNFIVALIEIILIAILLPRSNADCESCSLDYDCDACGKTPINIVTKNVIKVQLPLLQFENAYNENGYNINTGVSLESRINQTTIANVRGGPLGNDVYKYHKNTFYWTNCSDQIAGHAVDGVGTKLELQAYWYNTKYESFQEAMNYNDGLVIYVSLVDIGKENDGFEYFGNTTRQAQEPGSYADIVEGPNYSWIVAPQSSNELLYYYYRGQYRDEGTGQGNFCGYCATVLVSALNETKLSISQRQFDSSFNYLKNVFGGRLENKVPTYTAGQVFAAYGISNRNV